MIGVCVMPGSELYMDHARVSQHGQAAGDVGTNLAATSGNTAPGRVAAARAFPAWATSQAVLDLDAAHTEVINGHVEVIRSTAAGIQTFIGIVDSTDTTSARDIAGVMPGGI